MTKNKETKEEKKPTGAQSLAAAIDNFKKKLADDIQLAVDQKDTFTLLSSKNDEKVLNQILKLITIFDTNGKVADKLKAPIMDEISAEGTPDKDTPVKKGVPLKPGGNVYEHVVTELKNGNPRV